MIAKLWRDPRTLNGTLYVYDRFRSGETEYYVNDGGKMLRKTVPEGGPMEPLIELPWESWAAVSAELFNHGLVPVDPGADATQRHLADAVAVRDRILTLVERSK